LWTMIIFVVVVVAVLAASIFLLRERLRDSDWTNSAVLAALVIGGAAVFGAIANLVTTSISASYQSSAEMKKLQATMLLAILQENEPSYVPGRNEAMRKERITLALQFGLFSDDNGSICMAFVKEGCPIKVLKAK
jgi:hypothetical protein